MKRDKAVSMVGFVIAGLCMVAPVYGVENPKKQWYFGEGLQAGDEFAFSICDPVLRIPQTDNHCYVIDMRFLALLPTYDGMTWVVATHVTHDTKTSDMIFQISSDSFKIKTDGANIAYAESVERTVGWIRQFSNENKPQILSVGKSWGIVKADSSLPAHLMVNRIDYFELGAEPTYLLSHLLLKESQILIRDGLPFPIKATVYKPISSHQNIPLAFAFEMTDHKDTSDEVCRYVMPYAVSDLNPLQQNRDQPSGMVLSGQEGIQFQNKSIDVEEFTINDILRRSDGNSTVQEMLNGTYGDQYKEKLRQSIYNFTKFIEMIANASNTILQSQMDHINAPSSDNP